MSVVDSTRAPDCSANDAALIAPAGMSPAAAFAVVTTAKPAARTSAAPPAITATRRRRPLEFLTAATRRGSLGYLKVPGTDSSRTVIRRAWQGI
jgi:hypothetical protein